MNPLDLTLNIPFTVWRKGDSSPESGSLKWHTGYYTVEFEEPVNPFGSDRETRINKTFSQGGVEGSVDKLTWNNGYLYFHFHIRKIPEGGTITAIPIALVVGGIIAIVGMGIGILLLTRVQRVLELPVIPIILIALIIALVIKLIKTLREK